MKSFFKTGKRLVESFNWPITSILPSLCLMLLIMLGIYFVS